MGCSINDVGSVCSFCGEGKIIQFRSGKFGCSEKCWLKGAKIDDRKTGIDRFAENLRDNNIRQMAKEKREGIELAHSENMRATALDAASRMIAAKQGETGEVLDLAKQYHDWIVGKEETMKF